MKEFILEAGQDLAGLSEFLCEWEYDLDLIRFDEQTRRLEVKLSRSVLDPRAYTGNFFARLFHIRYTPMVMCAHFCDVLSFEFSDPYGIKATAIETVAVQNGKIVVRGEVPITLKINAKRPYLVQCTEPECAECP